MTVHENSKKFQLIKFIAGTTMCLSTYMVDFYSLLLLFIIIIHYRCLATADPSLVNLFMIWAELLSEEFLRFCFIKKDFFSNFSFLIFFPKQIKDEEKTADFMPGWMEGISGFCPSTPLHVFVLSHKQRRPFAISFFFSAPRWLSSNIFSCLFIPTQRHVAARDFLQLQDFISGRWKLEQASGEGRKCY